MIVTCWSLSGRVCSCQKPTTWPSSWATIPNLSQFFPMDMAWGPPPRRPTYEQHLEKKTHNPIQVIIELGTSETGTGQQFHTLYVLKCASVYIYTYIYNMYACTQLYVYLERNNCMFVKTHTFTLSVILGKESIKDRFPPYLFWPEIDLQSHIIKDTFAT